MSNNRVKYPRTMHFDFSQSVQNDDKVIWTLENFKNREVVVTEKMDGENTTLYRDAYHARSLDSRHHPSRDWIKSFHASIGYKIPKDWRVCGENMFAQHSIVYDNLESYFYGFFVWDEFNTALSWKDTLLFFQEIGVTPVKELYCGIFDLKVIQQLAEDLDTNLIEGLVCRVSDAFAFNEFETKVAKWVRTNHVQTEEHWMTKQVVPNKLKLISGESEK